jgi:uncharacterized protein (DUF3820 family)
LCPRITDCCCRHHHCAEVHECVDLFVKYTDWFAARTFPAETLRILLLLCQTSSEKLVKRLGFAGLLADFVDSKDRFSFAAAIILQQTPDDEAFLQDLQSVSFIFSLRETTRLIKKDKYWVYFIVAATRIAEMGYIQDLLIVIPELQKMVDKEANHKFLLPLLTGLLAPSYCVAAIRDSTAITRQVEALTADAALNFQAGEVLAVLRDS